LVTIFAEYLRRIYTYLAMMLAQVPRQWVDQEAIAGSERCASEEPPWPPYTLLDEPDMWRELRVLARPQSTPLGPNERYKADSVNFQPAPSSKTQDRYVVTQLEVNGRLWAFTGVFDGAEVSRFVFRFSC
jgi:pyruvate dehydrogenase phosphatase